VGNSLILQQTHSIKPIIRDIVLDQVFATNKQAQITLLVFKFQFK